MILTRDTSKKCANQSHETFIDPNQIEHLFGPCLRRSAQYSALNFEHYFPGDGPSENEGLVAGRQNNVKVYQMRSPEIPSDFRSRCLLAMQMLRNIDYGKAFSVDYGTSYNFDSN